MALLHQWFHLMLPHILRERAYKHLFIFLTRIPDLYGFYFYTVLLWSTLTSSPLLSLPPYWIFSLQREFSKVTFVKISREKQDCGEKGPHFTTESMVNAQWAPNFTSYFLLFSFKSEGRRKEKRETTQKCLSCMPFLSTVLLEVKYCSSRENHWTNVMIQIALHSLHSCGAQNESLYSFMGQFPHKSCVSAFSWPWIRPHLKIPRTVLCCQSTWTSQPPTLQYRNLDTH